MVTLAQYRQQFGGGGFAGEVAGGMQDIIQALLMYQLTQQKQERADEQTRYDREQEQLAFARGQVAASKTHVREEIKRIRTQYEASVQGAFAQHGTRVAQNDDVRRDVVLPFRVEGSEDGPIAYTLFDPEALGNALYEINAELFEELDALRNVGRDSDMARIWDQAGERGLGLLDLIVRESAPLQMSANGVYDTLMNSSEQGAVAAGAFRDRQTAGTVMPTSDFARRQAVVMDRYMPAMSEVNDDVKNFSELLPLTAENVTELGRLKKIAASTSSRADDRMIEEIGKSHAREKAKYAGYATSDSAAYAEAGMTPEESDANYLKRYNRAVQDFGAGKLDATGYKMISRPPGAAGNVDRAETFTGKLGTYAARRFSQIAQDKGNRPTIVATVNDGDYMFEIEIPNATFAMYRSATDPMFTDIAREQVKQTWEQSVRPVYGTDQEAPTTFKTFKGYTLRQPRAGRSPGDPRTELQVPSTDVAGDPLFSGEGIETQNDYRVMPDKGFYMPLQGPEPPPDPEVGNPDDFLYRGQIFFHDMPYDPNYSDFEPLTPPDRGPDAAVYPDMPPAFPTDMPPPNMLPPSELADQPALPPQMLDIERQLAAAQFPFSDEAAMLFAAGEERERQRRGAMANMSLLTDMLADMTDRKRTQDAAGRSNVDVLREMSSGIMDRVQSTAAREGISGGQVVRETRDPRAQTVRLLQQLLDESLQGVEDRATGAAYFDDYPPTFVPR